jgi:hypothetical protein
MGDEQRPERAQQTCGREPCHAPSGLGEFSSGSDPQGVALGFPVSAPSMRRRGLSSPGLTSFSQPNCLLLSQSFHLSIRSDPRVGLTRRLSSSFPGITGHFPTGTEKREAGRGLGRGNWGLWSHPPSFNFTTSRKTPRIGQCLLPSSSPVVHKLPLPEPMSRPPLLGVPCGLVVHPSIAGPTLLVFTRPDDGMGTWRPILRESGPLPARMGRTKLATWIHSTSRNLSPLGCFASVGSRHH